MAPKTGGRASEKQRSALLQRRLQRHFLTCSAALGAAAAFVPAPAAQAEIHYFDPADVGVPVNDLAGIYFNLETGAFGTSAAAVPGWDFNIFNPSAGNLYARSSPINGIIGSIQGANIFASRLDSGFSVDPGSLFYSWGSPIIMSQNNTIGEWIGTTQGFIGIYFTLADNSTVFGWIHVDIVNGCASVTAWAWEENKDPIDTGAIPEPTSLALSLLAAGAVGLRYWRKRKAESA